MSTFLSGMLSLAESVADTPPPKPAKQPNGDQKKGGMTRSARVQKRYAVAFAVPTTVGNAAAKMDISHVGCLNQLYRYEKRGLVMRMPEHVEVGAGGRAILWKWVTK